MRSQVEIFDLLVYFHIFCITLNLMPFPPFCCWFNPVFIPYFSFKYLFKKGTLQSRWKHPTSVIRRFLIRKAIRSSKNLRIHPKLQSGGILGNFVFRSGKNYGKKSYQEIIRSLQLVIRNELSLIRRKYVGLPDD